MAKIPWNKGKKGVQIAWNKGKKGIYSAAYKKKLSDSHKGLRNHLGIKHSEETKRKISIAKTNPSVETRRRIGLASLGRKHTRETKDKMGISHSKEKCHFWKGGVSFREYGYEWTGMLKRAIKERDKQVCQLCSDGNNRLDVHHIDYVKKNNDPNNLITLCMICHLKTNFNRDYWKEYFSVVMRGKYGN